MEAAFWQNLWDIGYTSFHRKDVHPYALRHATPEFLQGKRVLVPLCGKTNDMLWFRDHAAHVIGIELVEKGIEEFFSNNRLPYRKQGNRYEAEGLTILHADMFEVTREDVGQIDFVYDRASLVALPLEMRLRYLDKIRDLMPVGAQKMVITLEYDPFLPEPPFSITTPEMHAYYAADHEIAHLEDPELPHHPMVAKFGLTYLKEPCFLMTKR